MSRYSNKTRKSRRSISRRRNGGMMDDDMDGSKFSIDMYFSEPGRPKYTMIDAMRWYLDNIPTRGSLYSPMLLIEEGERKGIVKFNFNKRNGHLIIEEIAIYPRGGNLIENASHKILEDSRVNGVIISNIMSPDLKDKLISRGWKQLDQPDSVIFKGGNKKRRLNSKRRTRRLSTRRIQ